MNLQITAADTAWLISRCQEQGMRIERPTYDPNAPDAWAIKSRLKRAEKRRAQTHKEEEHGCECVVIGETLLSSSAAPTSPIKSSGDAGNLTDHRAAGGDY